MDFNFFKLFMSAFTLLFLVLTLGNILSKVKIKKFKFGISGNLFAGLAVGWCVYYYLHSLHKGDVHFASAQKLLAKGLVPSTLSHLFLYMFIASVGLLSAKGLKPVLKRYGLKFVSLSIIITFAGGVMTYGLRPYIGSGLYEMSGVYTAALTSSPGLAAALESTETSANKVVDGYETLSDSQKDKVLKAVDKSGTLTHTNTQHLTQPQKDIFIKEAIASTGASNAIGFPFGVIIVILSMTILPKIFGINVAKEREEFEIELANMKKVEAQTETTTIQEVFFDIAGFAFVIFMGFALGTVKVWLGPLGYFGLGSTGGILISSLVFGHFGKLWKFNFRMDQKALGIIKDIGLGSFVAIVGITYGYKVVNSFFNGGIMMAVYALVIAFLCMCLGLIIGKYLFKINWIMLSGAICGSMTSTPGLGAAIDAVETNEAGAGYAATYPFALIGMVLFTIILNNLPLY